MRRMHSANRQTCSILDHPRSQIFLPLRRCRTWSGMMTPSDADMCKCHSVKTDFAALVGCIPRQAAMETDSLQPTAIPAWVRGHSDAGVLLCVRSELRSGPQPAQKKGAHRCEPCDIRK